VPKASISWAFLELTGNHPSPLYNRGNSNDITIPSTRYSFWQNVGEHVDKL
jgi:hypothetical protein